MYRLIDLYASVYFTLSSMFNYYVGLGPNIVLLVGFVN